MTKAVEAWHFVGRTLRDGRPIPRDGKWLVHTGPVVICESGLHASRRPSHALEYAPGPILCRVECEEIVEEQADKLVCQRRRIIERADITETLHYYARMQALSVVHLYNDPTDAVLDYLMTGDEQLRAAVSTEAWGAINATTPRAAASTAARAAASAAASAAAVSAAVWGRAAASAAVWGRAAASAVVGAAASAAVWNSAQREFDALVYEQFGVEV